MICKSPSKKFSPHIVYSPSAGVFKRFESCFLVTVTHYRKYMVLNFKLISHSIKVVLFKEYLVPGFFPLDKKDTNKVLVGAPLVAQTLKDLPAVLEMWIKKIPRRREWLPTPKLLSGEFLGQRAWQAQVHGVAKS